MAIVNLKETIAFNIMRRNQLQEELASLQSQKSLAAFSQGDMQSLLNTEKTSIRDQFKTLFKNDKTLQEDYNHYTEIPDFEEQIDKITAEFQDKLDELAAWETAIDAQITTNSTELEEINTYMESYKSMLSTNIQEDFDFGLNG